MSEQKYYIESLTVSKLWGYRDIYLDFYEDVNILIGPNSSGKTTILELLYAILSGDLGGILKINFEEVVIRLRSFKSTSAETIKVEMKNDTLKFKVGRKVDSYTIDDYFRRSVSERIGNRFYRDKVARILSKEVENKLIPLVPLTWLPVSRRLPISEEVDEIYTRDRGLDPVDTRLDKVVNGLSAYSGRLNAQLSELYKKFENQMLSVILYSKENDQPDSILRPGFTSILPTESEKKQLLRAFEATGLLDKAMQVRIDEHFAAAEKTVKRLQETPDAVEQEDILVLPLIHRTKMMVEYAEALERERKQIFASLRQYEETVNAFLNDKSIEIDQNGDLKITSATSSDLDPRFLSSGEKQILILLTEALLKVDEPIVYVADEPELSLHVTWQEKLLESLVTLSGQIQVIVATHSPDMVGKFFDNVIDLGKAH